jgi:hypothetical protein
MTFEISAIYAIARLLYLDPHLSQLGPAPAATSL